MWKSDRIKQTFSCLIVALALCLALGSLACAQGAKVTTYKDANGWKLLVNGESHYVKGMVWGYTPIGENYAHDLWGKPEDYIKKVLDYDCALMKAAGVNTIRSFFNTPPKWVEYIYKEYGIMTIVNHTMGRYGYLINGVWRPKTDYSDPETRTVLKNDILNVVNTFKDTPGVLMFALGNENNYGLEWKSSEIENLPVGEQHREKAKHLYSLYNEIISAAKKIDADHPYTIVNGDIQYIDLIKEYCPDLDILGSNVYRGKSFINPQSNLWADVKKKLDLPIVFMEFGSDAYNERAKMEDQAAQADLLFDQWREIYQHSYGHGAEGNALGGCVFEWRDEWWKFEQTEDLDIHNTNASWANGGYAFDFVQGRNNMNEEWYGICQLGKPNADGVSVAIPRMAYYTLTDIWKIDPYKSSDAEIGAAFDLIDMPGLTLQSEIRLLKQERQKRAALELTGGKLQLEYVINGVDSALEEDGKDGLGFSDGEMLFLDFAFQPSNVLGGTFTLNMLGSVADKQLEIDYGQEEREEVVEFYNFEAKLELDAFDLELFHHVPRYHWGYEGDFFGLLWEATDMEGMDIWNAKAPSGVEFKGKGDLDGLQVVFGPEIYWGANPKVLMKYTRGDDSFKYTLMHSEDIARNTDSDSSTDVSNRATRATTLQAETDIIPGSTLQIGVISAGSEKIGDEFDYLDSGRVMVDEIDFADTLGAKAKLLYSGFDFGDVYFAAQYAGLVADGGEPLREFDTNLPYSQYGNKVEYEGGVGFFLGDFTIYPRVLYRKNLEDANPNIAASISGTTLSPGINVRNRDDDPFAVLDNREAKSAEIFFTYDPTPATDFYHWDAANMEDAPFAFNVGYTYTEFDTWTDAHLFYYKEGDINAAFGEGLWPEQVWKIFSRMVFNPDHDLKIATEFTAGYDQTTGAPNIQTRDYYNLQFAIDVDDTHGIQGYLVKDMWGPYDYYRQFGATYPWQIALGYSYKIGRLMNKPVTWRMNKEASIGVKTIYRTLDEDSPGDEYDNGRNDYTFETTFFLNYEF